MMQCMNEPTCTEFGCWIDRYVTCVWLCKILSFACMQGSQSSMFQLRASCKITNAQRESVVLVSKITTEHLKSVEICWSEPEGRQILAADFQVNSLWVSQLLMHAADLQTGTRHSSDSISHSISQPLCHQFPHKPHLINALHLFQIGCDSPMSFHYTVFKQTVMHTGPLLVFYQQVLMLL